MFTFLLSVQPLSTNFGKSPKTQTADLEPSFQIFVSAVHRSLARLRHPVQQREEALPQPEADSRPLHQLQDVPACQPPPEEEGTDPEALEPVWAGQEQPKDYFQLLDEGRLDYSLLKKRPIRNSHQVLQRNQQGPKKH